MLDLVFFLSEKDHRFHQNASNMTGMGKAVINY